MKKINIIIIFFLLGSIVNFYSQVPGYMGKRFSIEGDINLFPNFTNFILGNTSRETYIKENVNEYQYNYNTNTYEQVNYNIIYSSREKVIPPKYMRFTFKSSLAFNYSISKKADFSLRFNKIYGNFMFKDGNRLFFKENLKYQTSEVDLNFKFYRRGFIAPVGKYILFGIGLSKAKSKNNKGTLIVTSQNNFTNEPNIEQVDLSQSLNYFKINFGFGNKIVTKNNFYMLYGIEFASYFLIKSGINATDQNYIKDFKSNFNNNLTKNLNNDNLLNLKLGFGIIL